MWIPTKPWWAPRVCALRIFWGRNDSKNRDPCQPATIPRSSHCYFLWMFWLLVCNLTVFPWTREKKWNCGCPATVATWSPPVGARGVPPVWEEIASGECYQAGLHPQGKFRLDIREKFFSEWVWCSGTAAQGLVESPSPEVFTALGMWHWGTWGYGLRFGGLFQL